MIPSKALTGKYTQDGPRYTSYPPLPAWSRKSDEETHLNHIKINYNEDEGIDLYVHVPFCESLCYYCGCHRTITKNHQVEGPLIQSIMSEWDLYKSKLGMIPNVRSLHLGGGTPTFLAPSNLKFLIDYLTENRTTNFFGSIEIDPRTCSKDHLLILSNLGFKRISMGIQDFDEKVQKAINRFQTKELVQSIVSFARNVGFESINFDLIHGLPYQTPETIKSTFKIVESLNPDLIAFYRYAHLPDKIKHQKLIKNESVPGNYEKSVLYEKGKEVLTKAGYCEIGMDHFAKKNSYLYQSFESKKMQRNFMGYTDSKSATLIGLGPSAISDSTLSYRQNEKNFYEYQKKIDQGELPFNNGHDSTNEDLKVKSIIQNLMCFHEVNLREIHDLNHYPSIAKDLKDLENDQLIEFSGAKLRLSPIGEIFIRDVARVFDTYKFFNN